MKIQNNLLVLILSLFVVLDKSKYTYSAAFVSNAHGEASKPIGKLRGLRTASIIRPTSSLFYRNGDEEDQVFTLSSGMKVEEINFAATTTTMANSDNSLQLNPLELPRHSLSSTESLSSYMMMSLEMVLGKMAIVALIAWITIEFATGQSFPHCISSLLMMR